jgi:hypothetical protein
VSENLSKARQAAVEGRMEDCLMFTAVAVAAAVERIAEILEKTARRPS